METGISVCPTCGNHVECDLMDLEEGVIGLSYAMCDVCGSDARVWYEQDDSLFTILGWSEREGKHD